MMPSMTTEAAKVGAATAPPAVQQAAMAAAGNVGPQTVGRSTAINLAKDAAQASAETAATGFLEVRRYVQESPCSARVLSFCTALALLVCSILGVLNVFNSLFTPIQYLLAVYNVVFAAVIVVADGKPAWFRGWGDLQTKLFTSAAFLAVPAGRAALYFFVGSINMFLLPESWLWKVIYLSLGFALCFNGILMLLDACGCCGHRQTPPPAHEQTTGEV
jgi:hypothetical protein